MPREGIDIGDDHGPCLLPRTPANTLAVGDPGTRNRALEGAQNQGIAVHEIEPHPKETERLLESRRNVGEIRHQVRLRPHQTPNLGQQLGVALLPRCVGADNQLLSHETS